jgi:hypothetical protein
MVPLLFTVPTPRLFLISKRIAKSLICKLILKISLGVYLNLALESLDNSILKDPSASINPVMNQGSNKLDL